MRLYIMRHGEATPFAAAINITQSADAKRSLTAKGINQANVMGAWFSQQGIQLTDIFVSPYLRAQQTAQAIEQHLTTSSKITNTTLNFITPNDNADDFHAYLLGEMADKSAEQLANYQVLVVAHMPIVSYLVAAFTAQQQHPIFDTAAVACIDFNPESNTGELIEMVSPDTLV